MRTRDRTCRHFGCTRKALHADLDHHLRHPEGATSICNLARYATSETMTSPLGASGQMSAGSSVNAAAPHSGASVLKCRSSNVRFRVV